MSATIAVPVSSRAVVEKGILPWINREAIPLLRQFRDALNAEYATRRKLSTAATGAFANIWTSDPMPTNRAWLVEASVVARVTSGTAQRAAYIRRGLFYNEAGTVAQQGSTSSTYSEESAAGCDVRLLVSGQTVTFDVRDDGASTFAWVADVRVLSTDEV